MITKFVSRYNLSGSRIDRENGIIKGVALISLGDARGHGKAVDKQTLESVCECAKSYGDGLRVKFNPNTFTHGVGSLAGFIPPDSIRVKGGKTVGDLHLYKAFSTEAKEYLYEIVERTPGNIGLSIEFCGEDEEIKGEKFARCEEIFAATIVDLPAANPTGLFAAGDLTKDHEGKQSTDNQNTMDEATVTKLTTSLTESITSGLKAGFDQLTEKFTTIFANKEDDKEMLAAAGVTDKDDEATRKQKVEAYSAGKKPVTQMNAKELSTFIGEAVHQSNMQFFRKTGGKPAKASAEDDSTNRDEFEALIENQMQNGAKNKGRAINLARQLNPDAYNAWMAKQHPRVQTMEKK